MSEKTNNYAATGMLIFKPVNKVFDAFDAFISPPITSKFWFTKSMGILEQTLK